MPQLYFSIFIWSYAVLMFNNPTQFYQFTRSSLDHEIIADRVKFLDRQGAPAASGEAKPDEVEQPGEVEPDDIPF